jgi:two-component system cell cycle sensor histidine kinase/response regulator CckA
MTAKGSGNRARSGRRRLPAGADGELGAARPWLADLFREAPVGVACLDPHGVIVACNVAFCALFGEGGGVSLVGRHFADLIARPDRDDLARQFSKLLLGTARSVRLDNVGIETPGHRGRRVTLNAVPLAPTGDVGAVAVYALGEAIRGGSAASLARAQKMQALGQLAGGVAHDFNNLLTGMLGFCDLLLSRHAAGDSSHDDLLQIRGNALRAGNLVRQLLAFSRQQTLAPVCLAVSRALGELTGMLSRLLGPTIELVLSVDEGAFVEVDPGQFDQVIVNLAVNARDAMPGGGRLMLAAALVDVERPMAAGDETMPAGRWVRIEVSDSGVGIPKEILGNIFEPFFTTKEAGAGTGLGLATVFGIVRQTGGYVFVDSALGEGSTFTIYLPAVAAPAEAATPAAPAVAPAPHPPLPAPVLPSSPRSGGPARPEPVDGRRVVLLVDDEDPVRRVVARALRRAGFCVIEAASGEDALDLLAAGSGPIDVLLTDVVMPGIDGYSLARQVRCELPALPVVVMSGFQEDSLRTERGEDAIAGFLGKPFTLAELTQAVEAVVARA